MQRLSSLVFLSLGVVGAIGCPDDLDEFAPQGAIEPALLDLGPVPIGTTCTPLLAVTNTGGATLNITDGALADVDGDWAIGRVPEQVSLGGEGEVEMQYTAAGTAGTRQSVTLRLETNDPDNDGRISSSLQAIVVEETAAVGAILCPTESDTYEHCDGPVDFGAVNKGDPNVPIDQRTGITVSVKIKNEGSEQLTVNNVLLNDGNPDFAVQGLEQGNLVVDTPVVLEPSRTEACGQPGDNPDAEVTVNLFYAPTDIGADTETLVVLTDAINGGNLEVPLNGFGSDIGILLNPTAINFGDTVEDTEYVETITASNVGTNDAPVNNTCLDADGDETCDANCTGSDDDTALGGILKCEVLKADGETHEGKGFILAGTDATPGGDDERVVKVTFSPVAGNADLPANVFLRFETAIQNNAVWTARIVGGGIGNLAVSGGVTPCPSGVCIQAAGDPADVMTWTGQITLTLENTGDASLDVTALDWDGPATIADDYTLTDAGGNALDIAAPGISLGVGASTTLTLDYANNDFSGQDFINLEFANTGGQSPVVIPLSILPPTE